MLHTPVLEQEVIDVFTEQSRSPRRFLDGTFGRGGHTRSLLSHFKLAQVVAFDRDADALDYARQEFAKEIESGRLTLVHDDFKNIQKHKLGFFDGVLLDLGVSSPQLDEASRGFSFSKEGPLDMRMDRRQKITAAQVVNESPEKDLIEIFKAYGEVKNPARVVRAIVHDRKTQPYETTRQLASMIERVAGFGRRRDLHPATNYFMALRVFVNCELEGLEEFCEEIPLHMEPGSRLVIITFHSLEDRIIKWAFRKLHKKSGLMVNKKVIIASREELKNNPRARSAKLRAFEMGGGV